LKGSANAKIASNVLNISWGQMPPGCAPVMLLLRSTLVSDTRRLIAIPQSRR